MRSLALCAAALLLAAPLRAETEPRVYDLDVEGAQLAVLANRDPGAFANPGESCEDLEACVCSLDPTLLTRTRTNLDEMFTEYQWARLTGKVTPDQFIAVAEETLRNAEKEVYDLSKVTRDEIWMVLENTKALIAAEMTRRVSSHPSLSTSNDLLSSIQLRYGREYVRAVADELEESHPGAPYSVRKTRAYNIYHQRCGMNGFEVNAFSSPAIGPDREHMIVLCPGLVVGLTDFQTNKEATIASLSMIMGQELGFYLAEAQSDLFSKMTADISNRLGMELSEDMPVARQLFADLWGGYVLNEELKRVDDPEFRKVAIGLALQTVMAGAHGADRDSIASFRVAHIMSQFPELAATLGDWRPAWAKPACTARR